MSFVRLENLNDFIQPSTSCVKPTEKKKVGVVAKVSDINLTDCLACSGCITSAETILVQQQNHEELFKIINENKVSSAGRREIVVSLSLQSIASIASKHEIEAQEAAERLASFLVSLGCDKVYDINSARHIALIESYREFEELKKNIKGPVLTSICPGWICYAEKTNGDLIIPQLSKVRSPQQIMGALIKKSKPNVYHVTLMPCFDKKLEASRQEFKHDDGVQDVDCVLTPLELEEILESEGVTIQDFDRRKLDIPFETNPDIDRPLISHVGSASGGYAENILLSEAYKQMGYNSEELQLEYNQLKNTDFTEVTLKNHDQSLALPRVAIVNGFRNIQTIVQRLKRNALKYDYIQVMACPSGCINGGAQCKTDVDRAASIYKQVPLVRVGDSSNDEKIYKKLNLNPELDLRTSFHAVPKMQNLTVNW